MSSNMEYRWKREGGAWTAWISMPSDLKITFADSPVPRTVTFEVRAEFVPGWFRRASYADGRPLLPYMNSQRGLHMEWCVRDPHDDHLRSGYLWKRVEIKDVED